EGQHLSPAGEMVPGELGEWFPTYSNANIKNHLYRGHFVYQNCYQGTWTQLIIVEGFKAAIWLAQHGWPFVVAIMGSVMTESQERIIRKMGCETWVFLDANYAGRKGSRDLCWRLGNATSPVYECQYPSLEEDPDEGLSINTELQPTDFSETEI